MRGLPARKRRITNDVGLAIVNIVFLLIFFFLTTGQLLSNAAQGVEIAETTELPLDRLPKPILVVGAGGSLELDGRPVTADLLGVAVRGTGVAEPITLLHVLIARDALAGALLDVIGRPELAPVSLRLVTLRKGATVR
jgi:hypothetical protein